MVLIPLSSHEHVQDMILRSVELTLSSPGIHQYKHSVQYVQKWSQPNLNAQVKRPRNASTESTVYLKCRCQTPDLCTSPMQTCLPSIHHHRSSSAYHCRSYHPITTPPTHFPTQLVPQKPSHTKPHHSIINCSYTARAEGFERIVYVCG